MKKLNSILLIIAGFFVINCLTAQQQVNTLYFLENVPLRHTFNPAIQPLSGFYLSLPVVGNTQLNVGNNSFTASSLNLSKTDLYTSLKPITYINANADINLFGFGFRAKSSYINFTLTSKNAINVSLPKDMFHLGMFGNVRTNNGVAQLENNVFDMSSLGFNATSYLEAALGYSRFLGEKWSAGIKLKYLHGLATSNLRFDNFKYVAGIEQWKLNIDGSVNYSLPDVSNFNPTSLLQPAGIGGAADLGVMYRAADNLIFGAAVTDLGLMKWNKSPVNYRGKVDFTMNTITGFSIDELLAGINSNSVTNDLYTDFLDSVEINKSATSFNNSLVPRINLSGEYGFFQNTMSVGLLSSTMVYKNSLQFSLTPSLNIHPANWLSMSLSYSLLNGKGSNVGLGLGLRLGILNAFLTADYIPFNYAPLSKPLNLDLTNIPLIGNSLGVKTISSVPAKTERLNVAIGFNIVFGNKQDSDKDGVSNRRDKCPDTPHGVIVDKKGCPLDTDGDKVPDYYDKCPDTPKEAYSTIDADGCPLDTDGDGVFDYLDKCPDTPYQAYGKVDKKGCPKDTDKDGVPDYLDKCPATPESERNNVDSLGCTIVKVQPVVVDTVVAPVVVSKPDTVAVVADVDTDGDGIVDRLDRCPQLAGVASNGGCPEIKREVRVIFQKALQGIQFETAKYTIKPLSYVILEHVARVLTENPNYLVEIRGHTDNEGTPEKNQILSENRAKAVRDYLISKGIDAKRLTSNGYGQMRPVAPNSTIEGRAKNRRVEFVVSFE